MKKKKFYLPVIATAALALSFSATAHDAQASVNTYQVNVPTGYLALRNAANADDSNIFGQLYTGDLVEVSDYAIATGYWYVYSPKYDAFGYVNNDYLNAINSSSGYYYDSQWTVSVSTGYLALRTDKAYNSSNEIGQLYTGDTVSVFNSSDPAYWYVYSPRLNQYGYVNKDYLTGGVVGAVGTVSLYAGETRVVNIATGYLALRNMKAYDSSNEIGQLYTGDTVQILDTSDAQYWYVYSPKYDLNGFVNKDYLSGTASYSSRTVRVSKEYLAQDFCTGILFSVCQMERRQHERNCETKKTSGGFGLSLTVYAAVCTGLFTWNDFQCGRSGKVHRGLGLRSAY